MTLKPYSDYKASGIAWLGDVPESWPMERIRRRVHLRTDKATGAHRKVALENVESWTGRFVENEDADYSGDGINFSPGDVLFGKLRPYLAKSWLADTPGAAVGDFHVYSLDPSMEARFFQYMLLSRDFISLVDGSTYGAKMPRASWEFIGNLIMTFPSHQEQRQIADYLDGQTAKIDALIGKQEQLIETLAERRQAVISHAVTKGLDANAPMKDSGIYWLGAVPDSWSVRKFSQVTRINGGQVDPRIEPYRLMTLIAPNHIEQGTGRLLARETAADQGADSGKYLVREGQVIYSKIRPALRKAVIAPEVCLCSADMYGIDADTSLISNEFLLVLMLSRPFTQFVVDVSMRVAMPKVNRETLSAGALWFPEHVEQARILEYLNRETAQIDALSTKAREMIDVLKERRQALISAAVTGKIDVRGL